LLGGGAALPEVPEDPEEAVTVGVLTEAPEPLLLKMAAAVIAPAAPMPRRIQRI